MRKVYGALLIAVLWGAVVAPVLGPHESFVPEPAGAQVPFALYVVGSCLADPVCIAWVGLGVTAIAATACAAGQDCSLSWLEGIADELVDLFSDEGYHPGVEQFKRQYEAHPFYYYLTGQMLSEWAEWLIDYMNAGWVTETVAGYQCAVMRVTTPSNGAPYTMYGRFWESEEWSAPAGVYDFGGGFQFRLAMPAGGANGYKYNVHWEIWKGPLDTGVLLIDQEKQGTVLAGWAASTVETGYPADEADIMGTLLSARVEAWENVGTGWETVDAWHDMSVRYFDSVQQKYVYSYLHPVDMAIEGAWVPAGEGNVVNTVLGVDSLVGWDGVTELPLASGTTGAVVVAEAEWATPAEKDWWEGLFGGLTDPLGRIWDVVRDIPGHLTDIWEAVQALPDTMVTAISAAVVPSESVSERTGDLGDTLAAKAPFAWPVVVFAVVSDLFEGGTDCPTINMGTESVGWPAVEMEMCVPSGAQTILYTLTDVVAAAMVMVWAYWVYRRLVGS